MHICQRRSTFRNLHWKKFCNLPSVHSYSTILYDYVSHLGNMGYPCDSAVILAVPSYHNMPLVNSCPSPLKTESQLSFQIVYNTFLCRLDHNMIGLEILLNRTPLLSQHFENPQSLIISFGLPHQRLLQTSIRSIDFCS